MPHPKGHDRWLLKLLLIIEFYTHTNQTHMLRCVTGVVQIWHICIPMKQARYANQQFKHCAIKWN